MSAFTDRHPRCKFNPLGYSVKEHASDCVRKHENFDPMAYGGQAQLGQQDRVDAAAFANQAIGQLNHQNLASERLMAAQGQSALGQQGQLLNDLAAFRDMAMASRTVTYDKVEALEGRVKKLEALLSKVCVEHEDCCQSLLAHACKNTSQQASEEKK